MSTTLALHTPLRMSIDMRKPVTVRLEAELHAQAFDEARRRNDSDTEPKVGPFCAWCVRQILTLEFLLPENREFIGGILRELGRPWTLLDVLDTIVSTFRKEVRAGRVRPVFWSGQLESLKKNGAR